MALLIGGVSLDDQLKKLDRGVDVLIATPGRLLDLFERGKMLLNGVEILVIDEADRMLDMGFIPDIEKICKLLPANRQTLFFSATMPPEITRLVEYLPEGPGAHRGGAARHRRQDHHPAVPLLPLHRGLGEARGAARPDPLRAGQERHHLLQSQARRGDPPEVAAEARLQRRARSTATWTR